MYTFGKWDNFEQERQCTYNVIFRRFPATKKLKLKNNNFASAGSHGKYMEYISFPWFPVVAAHDRKRLA
jgi:hypothetical protein